MPQKIKASPCDQCLFGKNRIVSQARKKEIIQQCVRSDTHFSCHKHSREGDGEERGEERGEDVVCAGFMKAYPGVGQVLRICGRANALEPV